MVGVREIMAFPGNPTLIGRPTENLQLMIGLGGKFRMKLSDSRRCAVSFIFAMMTLLPVAVANVSKSSHHLRV